MLSVSVITLGALYALLRRQWLHYLRAQAVETASSLTASAQNFDAAAAAAMTWIQEVELVSRGYRMWVDYLLLGQASRNTNFGVEAALFLPLVVLRSKAKQEDANAYVELSIGFLAPC